MFNACQLLRSLIGAGLMPTHIPGPIAHVDELKRNFRVIDSRPPSPIVIIFGEGASSHWDRTFKNFGMFSEIFGHLRI